MSLPAMAHVHKRQLDKEIDTFEIKKKRATLLSLLTEGKNCTSCIWLNNRLAKCGKGKKIVSVYSICSKHTERKE